MHSSGGHVMLNFSLMKIFNWKHSWMCWIYNILCFKLLPFCLIGTLKRSKLGFVRIFLYSLCVLVRTVLAKHDPTWFHSVHFLGQRRGRINERTSLCRVKSNTEPARCACLKETKQYKHSFITNILEMNEKTVLEMKSMCVRISRLNYSPNEKGGTYVSLKITYASLQNSYLYSPYCCSKPWHKSETEEERCFPCNYNEWWLKIQILQKDI